MFIGHLAPHKRGAHINRPYSRPKPPSSHPRSRTNRRSPPRTQPISRPRFRARRPRSPPCHCSCSHSSPRDHRYLRRRNRPPRSLPAPNPHTRRGRATYCPGRRPIRGQQTRTTLDIPSRQRRPRHNHRPHHKKGPDTPSRNRPDSPSSLVVYQTQSHHHH